MKNNSRYLTIPLLLLFLNIVMVFKTTAAFFSDSGQSKNNTFAAAVVFPTLSPTPSPTPSVANHLVINETLYDTTSAQNISGEGGSNRGEWVEIYNPTGLSVDLSTWTIEDNTSSETLSGIIPTGGFAILTGATQAEFTSIWIVPAGTIFIQSSGGTIGNGLANGGDRIVLKNGSSEIDKMSWGTDTSGFSSGCVGSCPTSPTGQSLERNPIGVDTDSAINFIIKNPPTPGT